MIKYTEVIIGQGHYIASNEPIKKNDWAYMNGKIILNNKVLPRSRYTRLLKPKDQNFCNKFRRSVAKELMRWKTALRPDTLFISPGANRILGYKKKIMDLDVYELNYSMEPDKFILAITYKSKI